MNHIHLCQKIRFDYERGATLADLCKKYGLPYKKLRLMIIEAGGSIRTKQEIGDMQAAPIPPPEEYERRKEEVRKAALRAKRNQSGVPSRGPGVTATRVVTFPF